MLSKDLSILSTNHSEAASNRMPLKIAFVSGKGGVGKTMLAVAFAREISIKSRTLIIDLDFFNRGLTGLMGSGQKLHSVDKPSFLQGADGGQSEWYVTEVRDNLFHISYPDLLPPDMQKFGTLPIDILTDSLERFIAKAASLCHCDCVVLDCHGGPDNSSFAACLISDYSLLISEPDRVTFYGTLNFLRQLRRMSGEKEVDLRLVFNKVVPAFSALFLRAFYNSALKELFSGKSLLAVYPLEVYLTKEFERTPFLTSVYPNSLLAKKTRVLIYDLLFGQHKDKLSTFIKSTPKLIRVYTKFSLGKTTPLFNLNSMMGTIVTVLMAVILLNLVLASVYKSDINDTREEVQRLQLLSTLKVKSALIEEDDKRSTDTSPLKAFAGRQIDIFQLRDELRSEKADVEEELEEGISNRSSPRTTLSQLQKLSASKTAQLAAIADLDAGPHSSSYLNANLMNKRSNLLVLGIPKDLGSFEAFYEEDYSSLRNKGTLFVILQTAKEDIDPYLPIIGVCGLLWIVITFLMLWIRELDRRFTYYSRQNKYVAMVSYFFVAVALWVGPALALGFVIDAFHDSNAGAQIVPLMLSFGVPIVIALDQLSRVYADLRYRRHLVEDVVRVLFIGYLLAAPILLRGLTH